MFFLSVILVVFQVTYHVTNSRGEISLNVPTTEPSYSPTLTPSEAPVTRIPTVSPTTIPSLSPSTFPSLSPTTPGICGNVTCCFQSSMDIQGFRVNQVELLPLATGVDNVGYAYYVTFVEPSSENTRLAVGGYFDNEIQDLVFHIQCSATRGEDSPWHHLVSSMEYGYYYTAVNAPLPANWYDPSFSGNGALSYQDPLRFKNQYYSQDQCGQTSINDRVLGIPFSSRRSAVFFTDVPSSCIDAIS